MICVSIGRGRHKHVIAEHKHLVEQGAQLCELRLDYITGTIKLRRLLENRPGPVVITYRRERDGGRYSGDEQARQMVLRTAIAEGADYVDLEEDIAASVPRYGKTKRIISYHNFRETPADLEGLHRRMQQLDPDIVKIATMANSPQDNVRILELARNSEIPTIGLCMGDMGMPSRILGGRFGCPFTYATSSNERTLAPGQIGFRQMVDLYRYEEITDETELYGVVADPVGHSLSPHLHNAAFSEQGMNRSYLPFRVPREHLAVFLSEVCPQLGVKGLSVTIPHKEAAAQFVQHPDDAVKGVGATNTIVFDEKGTSGFNTDCDSAMESLDTALPPESRGGSLEGKRVLILGSGGVARGIVWALKQRKATIIISSRTQENAEELAAHFGCRSIHWDDRGSVVPDILINGTPVGMHPNVNETPFDKRWIKPSMLVFDTVYNPEQTLLVKESRATGARVVTGVEMFVRQAALQFKHFTGVETSRELMRSTLKRITGAVRTN
ncbi:shikimate dehydrogenase [Blastopirellula marina]|uniref:Multifunctional fusion protein n=1 Tax=Blastopirellula marina TaxID=124 RepID=A0A2S8GEH7_9BACT|nr:shikimate dehydrogenase [Blastopirellula marina]PQO42720.1 shikimate dehydrogenase [Blastopirellula marina]PTL46486.1 shikimate dehydrogenase [Blastopirellula marina]